MRGRQARPISGRFTRAVQPAGRGLHSGVDMLVTLASWSVLASKLRPLDLLLARALAFHLNLAGIRL
jgi:hypothetical protein